MESCYVRMDSRMALLALPETLRCCRKAQFDSVKNKRLNTVTSSTVISFMNNNWICKLFEMRFQN